MGLEPGRMLLMQGLLLTAYLKFLIADPGDANLRSLAEEVFQRYSRRVALPAGTRCRARSSRCLFLHHRSEHLTCDQ